MKRKQLLLKQLRILSTPEKSARLVIFHSRSNLITGENDVGKSSIIKSIYHTLGADVHFDNVWAKADVISLLSFSFDGVDYSILRARNHFGIFDSKNNLIRSFDSIIKGLSPFFAELFNNKLKLRQSQTNRRIPASPAIQFLPFYIDQDKSWNVPWNAFEGLGTFTSFRRDLIEFFTGIKPNEWYLFSERIDVITAQISELKKEETTLRSAKRTVSQYIPKATFDIDINAFKKEIDKLLVHLRTLKAQEDRYRKNLIKQKSHEAFLDNEITVVNKSIREISKDYDHSLKDLDGEITCPTCNAVYENSMVSRFGFLGDIDTCRGLLADYIDDKKSITKNVSKLEHQLNLQRSKVREITSLLDEKKGKVRLKDLIKNESSKQVKKIFEKSEADYADKISKLEIEAADLKGNRLNLNNKERKESIISRFNSLIDTFFIKLNVQTLNSSGFNDIPLSVKSQGSDTPRALLAYYYAMLFTSQEFTSLPLLPLIIDSPNQQDQDAINRNKIIQLIFDNTPEEYQLILGTVDLHGVEYNGHIISPSNKLNVLNKDDYDETYKVIAPLLDSLHESLIVNG